MPLANLSSSLPIWYDRVPADRRSGSNVGTAGFRNPDYRIPVDPISTGGGRSEARQEDGMPDRGSSGS
jgi:hypothetical protein